MRVCWGWGVGGWLGGGSKWLVWCARILSALGVGGWGGVGWGNQACGVCTCVLMHTAMGQPLFSMYWALCTAVCQVYSTAFKHKQKQLYVLCILRCSSRNRYYLYIFVCMYTGSLSRYVARPLMQPLTSWPRGYRIWECCTLLVRGCLVPYALVQYIAVYVGREFRNTQKCASQSRLYTYCRASKGDGWEPQHGTWTRKHATRKYTYNEIEVAGKQ